MYLSRNIRYLRKTHGMSQEHLANMLGYKSYTTIQKWESGVSEPPLKVAHSIAELFHVDIDELTKTDLSAPITETPTPAPIVLSPDEAAFLQSYRNLPPDGQAYMQQTMDMAVKTYEKK